MKRERNILFITLGVLWLTAAGAGAGELDPPAGPDDPLSAVYTLEDLYNRLDTGAQGAKRTGAVTGPAGQPGASGRSLESIMGKMPEPNNTDGVTPAEVPAGKIFWGLRTDGSWGPRAGTGLLNTACTGTLSPAGRWCDQGNGTVRDMSTNLVWLKEGSFHRIEYAEAVSTAYNMKDGYRAGLSDGSKKGDWRLPNPKEYEQLTTGTEPIQGSNHFFKTFNHSTYWSCLTFGNVLNFEGGTFNIVIVEIPTLKLIDYPFSKNPFERFEAMFVRPAD